MPRDRRTPARFRDVMIRLQSKGTEATLRYFSSLTQSSGTEAEEKKPSDQDLGSSECPSQVSEPSSPSKKRRKTSNQSNTNSQQQSPSLPDLIPPPPSDKGDTIFAHNPFEDQPAPVRPPQPNHLQDQYRLHPALQQQQHQQHNMHTKPTGPQRPPGPPHPHPGAAKIYPSNQPMVFNPSNPNAPPIYPCGICHKEVHDNDQAILCESGCNFWFHRSCTGLTEPAYHMLTQEVYAEWVCDRCRSCKNIPMVKMKP